MTETSRGLWTVDRLSLVHVQSADLHQKGEQLAVTPPDDTQTSQPLVPSTLPCLLFEHGRSLPYFAE